MKLQARCDNCKAYLLFHANVSDRFELARKRSDNIELKCSNCGTNKTYKVNEIRAVENKILSLLDVLIFLAGTIGLFAYLWPFFFKILYIYTIAGLVGALTIPFLIYQAINHGRENKVQYFNSKRYG
ncbi:hypothetical protein [uncultured Marivirga sp.]|uniref:hypothetical protein n=1 Tax=uncultured Marivirga sp. TaxID=1123707 RepID=UPI0030EF6BEC